MEVDKDMNSSDVLRIVAEIAQKDSGEILPETRLDDLHWDSLCNLLFIAKIDQIQGIELDVDTLSSAKTVQNLIALVSSE